MSKLKVYDPKKGREVTVGEIQGTSFIKRVSSNHYMRKYNGYGIDIFVLEKLKQLKIPYIMIKASSVEYFVELNVWLEEGTLDDFGHGKQIFLPVVRMKRK